MPNLSNRASLRVSLIVGYTNVLKHVRKSVKGLLAGNIEGIMLIGELPGSRLIEIVVMTGRTRQSTYNRLTRDILAGWIYKANKLYYLTDRGQQVYDLICKAFDKEYKAITTAIIKDVQKRLE